MTLPSRAHPVPMEMLLQALSSFYGVTTADGNQAGTTLICSTVIGLNDFITNKTVLLQSGNSIYEDRGATGFIPGNGQITVNPAFSSRVLAGTSFYILNHFSAALVGVLLNLVLTRIGDPSAHTLPSLTDKLGNNATDFWTAIGYQGATSLADKLTAARAAFLDRLALLAAGGAGELTPGRATNLDRLDALVSSRAEPGDAMDLTVATLLVIRDLILTDATPFPGTYIDEHITSRAMPGDDMSLTGAALTLIQNLLLSDATPFAGANINKLANIEHETEWGTTPASEPVASAAETDLAAQSITPTFPTGSTPVRAILISSIHAANQGANTHHIGIKVKGQKAGGGYSTLLDLTTHPPLGLQNVDGSGDGWSGALDVTALVDTSGVQYDFRFAVDSDNAGAVIYTTGFVLVFVYKM